MGFRVGATGDPGVCLGVSFVEHLVSTSHAFVLSGPSFLDGHGVVSRLMMRIAGLLTGACRGY